MDATVENIRAEVEAHGWQVVLFPAEGDAPAYGHTVGLSRTGGPSNPEGHPELVVVGLDDGADGGLTHELLESAAEMVAAGRRFEPGTTSADLLDGHIVAVRPVSARSRAALLEIAQQVLGGDVRAVQLVWPDRRGLLPWSPACDPAVRARQPLLDT